MVYKGVIDPCNCCKQVALTSTGAGVIIAVDGMVGLVNPVFEHKVERSVGQRPLIEFVFESTPLCVQRCNMRTLRLAHCESYVPLLCIS